MSLPELYVGNYPCHFTEDRVLFFFQDFQGIEMDRFINNPESKKSFCFLKCVDQKQADEAVATLNGIDVCGRNLVVRVNDKKRNRSVPKEKQLQKIQYKDAISASEGCSYDSIVRNVKDYVPIDKSSFANKTRGDHYEHKLTGSNSVNNDMDVNSHHSDIFDQKHKYDLQKNLYYKDSPQKNITVARFNQLDSFNQHKHADYLQKSKSSKTSPKNTSADIQHNPDKNFNDHSNKPDVSNLRNEEFEGNSSVHSINVQEAFTKLPKKNFTPLCDKFSSLMSKSYGCRQADIGNLDQRQMLSISSSEDQFSESCSFSNQSRNEFDSKSTASSECEVSKEDLNFVSVTNFPFYTSLTDLYQLFEDFDPLHIWMLCNYPNEDRLQTEAIVCFDSFADATNAIINLDNTFFGKRILFVNDPDDLSMIPELLSISKRKLKRC